MAKDNFKGTGGRKVKKRMKELTMKRLAKGSGRGVGSSAADAASGKAGRILGSSKSYYLVQYAEKSSPP